MSFPYQLLVYIITYQKYIITLDWYIYNYFRINNTNLLQTSFRDFGKSFDRFSSFSTTFFGREKKIKWYNVEQRFRRLSTISVVTNEIIIYLVNNIYSRRNKKLIHTSFKDKYFKLK